MSGIFRPVIFVLLASALSACGGSLWKAKEEIIGNSTGGYIPASLAKGDVQATANAFCATYRRTARITFTQEQAAGDVVFVCADAAAPAPGPTVIPAPSAPPPAPKRPPAR
ncbi:MAG: hypothetical protein Q7S17_09735 [Xanthobacteraceae bacterium]|nr:hypothetical protein [Xanthobacteraceae bacterium]